ncbi:MULTISPECIES: winged helix-turn-helix domain-containing protein [unclassified Brenneria]|uniref:winged helix-turn-helix domain-containing protein n=1 Tax=unclassified Brenneria TaxID=2634434 RepID=UPI001554FEB0|nr:MULTISPECIES: winged helix-turn-helix domain-containing protein [unclassified Brenneria]MBJ7221531.1 winged helix-turn-helix domain-containing protein [Brenneria sp. L3-3C-1]MEE3642773.1 winged helix-turn-helix domain-containing protein [Brenneria sp. L3_3C_1]MEE3651045.1 winged helix-turn-helix domain-containing protein [Brenneria sp. HEZEL_4_2_4]NPD01000.1 transcriptional regulator [Brenneria sp. hezel4-2-4]
MIYIIAEEIRFNPDDCTLVNHQDDDFIKLSIPACRLLEQLLLSGGETLTREYLLTEVWDKYGLRGTNSNLNQYISILRRALAGYGCENLIVTIPKIGFRLNTDIPIHRDDAAPPLSLEQPLPVEETPPVEQAPSAVQPPETPANPAQNGSNNKRKTWFLILCVGFSLLLVGLLLLQFRDPLEEREIEPVNDVLQGDCNVTYLKNMDSKDREAIDKQIVKILDENKLQCGKNRKIIFDNYTSYSTQSYGRTMLSFCQLGIKNDIISCDNFYYYDWR